MERRRIRGFIRRPTKADVIELASMEYMTLSDQEAEEICSVLDDVLDSVDRIDDIYHPNFKVTWNDRNPGYRPSPEEDPYNLFIRKCLVKGASEGKLFGKRIAVKDSIAVAGVPMTNGSRAFTGLIPEHDAVVVERILNAGGTIVGKLNQDDMSFSGTSDTSSFGQVKNPLNTEYSPGGSSSAAGAALITGEADIALAVDQAGSSRIPAAWTGTYTIKPTQGLVPSFGIFHMDHTMDFICPVAQSIEETAKVLEVIAGEDERDPQWVRGAIKTDKYTEHLTRNINNLKVGILKEGFNWDFSDKEVDEHVLNVAKELESMGATSKEVSLPLWKDALPIWNTLFAHSASAMIESDEQGYWHGGDAVPTFAEAFGKFRRTESDHFPPLVKTIMIQGKYLRREYYNAYFAKAQNLRNELRKQIDSLLEEVDVLITPTIPTKPSKLLTEKTDIYKTLIEKSQAYIHNTCPLNLTGHPALALPCGFDQHSLPISVQLIGKHWAESQLFNVGYAYEQNQVGKSRPIK